jgi:drug/metabolite transporter (DMT)-like permease
MTLIYAIAVAIAAQTFIYSGLIFMTGKLLPNLLAPIYQLAPNVSYRVAFSTFTVMFIGNYLFQRLYSLQPVLVAGIISTVTGILIINTGGLIIERKPPNLLMVIGVVILVTGAVVCVHARDRL